MPETTKEQREELKRLAGEATPGPWQSDDGDKTVVTLAYDPDGPCYSPDDNYFVVGYDEDHRAGDMRYIAKANSAAVLALLHDVEAAEQHVGGLLARIHRDGGHYQAEHGMEKAVADAYEIVASLLQEKDRADRLAVLLREAWSYATGEDGLVSDECAEAEGECFADLNRRINAVLAEE